MQQQRLQQGAATTESVGAAAHDDMPIDDRRGADASGSDAHFVGASDDQMAVDAGVTRIDTAASSLDEQPVAVALLVDGPESTPDTVTDEEVADEMAIDAPREN